MSTHGTFVCNACWYVRTANRLRICTTCLNAGRTKTRYKQRKSRLKMCKKDEPPPTPSIRVCKVWRSR